MRLRRCCTTHIAVSLALLSASAGCALLGFGPPAGLPGTIYNLAGESFTVEPVIGGLEVPWSMQFAPDGRLLVTERPGRLRVIDVAAGAVLETHVVSGVVATGEGGLMGLALSPRFAEDQLVYLGYTASGGGGGVKNVIERFRLAGGALERIDPAPIVDNLPGGSNHDGLRIHFGPDGRLYASTGDARQPSRAQELAYLGGKFLRIDPDGSVPRDNPFPGSPIWSLGHRNPQGFAFHPALPEVMLATEHGSSFLLDGTGGQDEVNRIMAGRNYGWPLYRGDQMAEGFEPPLYQSGGEAIAPAGAAFCTGRRHPAWANAFLFVGLRGESLWVVHLAGGDPNRIELMSRGLRGEFGRLRAIAEGPDGTVYLSTSNRDGRGAPGPNDDRILRLAPAGK